MTPDFTLEGLEPKFMVVSASLERELKGPGDGGQGGEQRAFNFIRNIVKNRWEANTTLFFQFHYSIN